MGDDDFARAQKRPDDVLAAILRDHAEIKQLFSRVTSERGAARREAFEDLVRKLAVHETAEEEIVHPLARQADEAVVSQRLHEEDDAKRALSGLESMDVDDADFGVELGAVQRAVLDHAEHEEHLEFPLIEQRCDEDRLRQLGDMFRAAEAIAPTHPHPHAPESATGNIVVGPVAAVIDRARDAVRDAIRASRD